MKIRRCGLTLLLTGSFFLSGFTTAHATVTYDLTTVPGPMGSSVDGFITFPMSSVGASSFNIEEAVTFSFTLHDAFTPGGAPIEQTWTPALFHNGVLEFNGVIGDAVLRGANLGTDGYQRWVMSTQGADPTPTRLLISGDFNLPEWQVAELFFGEDGVRNNFAWTFTMRSEIPGPSILFLLATGLVGLAGYVRRRS